VRFQVRYWRWASYVLVLGAVLGLVGIVLLLTLDVRTYIADGAEPQADSRGRPTSARRARSLSLLRARAHEVCGSSPAVP
jgi:hypothetical protein